MSALPSLGDIRADIHALDQTLSILFEHSPILSDNLAPRITEALQTKAPLQTYSELVDLSLATIQTEWPDDLKARFIEGHPRIGEVNGLSKLSAKEQAAAATPPEVLGRLVHLNACYEYKYPGLRYITFVNGRTRAVIMEEMEDVLGFERSLSASEPTVQSVKKVEVGDQDWKAELNRAVVDVGRIAKSRLRTLCVE